VNVCVLKKYMVIHTNVILGFVFVFVIEYHYFLFCFAGFCLIPVVLSFALHTFGWFHLAFYLTKHLVVLYEVEVLDLFAKLCDK
jgi:hypothetical protein